MSFVLRLPQTMHLCRSSSNVPRLPSFLEMLQNPHVLLTFDKVHNPLRLPRETTSERPKVVRTWCVLYMLTSKCASCQNGVHFFDISTSKSAPYPSSFFPRASERRVLPIVGVCKTSSHLHSFSSSHLLILPPHIFTCSHLYIFSSSHLLILPPLIFTSSHLYIFSSSHLLIVHPHIFTSSHLTSSHLHIFSSLHLLIFTSSHLTSSHLLIFTSSHLHIFSSSHLLILILTSSHLIFTSAHIHIFSSSHLHIFTSSHLHIFSSSHLLSCPLPLLPSCSLLLFYFSLEGAGQCQRDGTKRNPFARNEVRSPKTEVKL